MRPRQKENYNPNKKALNQSTNCKNQRPSNTPDTNTSGKKEFIPRFIKRDKIKEDQLKNQLSVGTPQ